MSPKPSNRRKLKGGGRRGAADPLPVEQVRKWIDLMDERGLEEFELEKDGFHLRIRRRGGTVGPPPVFESYEPRGEILEGGTTAASRGPEPVHTEAPVVAEDVHIVKSPIVGTFYASPQPDAPPFVNLGDLVEVGQVLCIVEAMKLMNEIEADVAGEVVRIYAENSQPVEYGDPLFALRPTRKR